MDPDKEKEHTVMSIIKPILRVNQFFGVCAHEISGDLMIFRWRSFRVLHTFVTFLVICSYFMYMLYQFIVSFSSSRKRGIPEMVSLAIWLGGTLAPICLLVVSFKKRNKFSLFFEKMWEYKVPLKGMIKCEKTLKYSRNLYGFYILLCILSCGCVTFSTIRRPLQDICILNLFYSPDETPSSMMIAVGCAFQCYLVIVKSCASAFIEVLSSSLAKSFDNTTKTIVKELKKSLGGSPRFQRPFNATSSAKSLGALRDNGIYPKKDMNYHPHVSMINEQQNIIMGHRSLYPVIPSVEESTQNADLRFSLKPYPAPRQYSHDEHGNMYAESMTDGAGPIILAIKRFNCIANMQRLINCIFGLILALDTALLVFMSCLLLFLQINYLGSTNVDKMDGIIYSGNAICFFIRLVIMFINLGNVHETSIFFNGVLTSSLMQVKKPKASDVNLILAHLSAHSGNPVSYSAGGFFVFSKSSLLAVMSVIMTYVVFLLQAKN
jgi:hypothetical protein